MAFTKINAAGIGTTETVTVDGLTVINDGSFGGNLTVSGVLTYEDVTNVDSVGLITARNGIVVGSGITLSKDGDIFATGITTVSGNVKVGTGITLSSDGDGFFTGVTTSTTFVGNLTGNVTGTLQTAAQTNITSVGSLSSLVVTGGITATGGNVVMNDSSGSSANRIKLGTSQDLSLYHDGTDSIISNATGDLYINNTGGSSDDVHIQAADDILLRPQGGENGIKVIGDGAVELYHNNSKRLETDANGIHVTTNVHLPDNGVLEIGTDSDLQLYHDGSNSYIKDTGTGVLVVNSNQMHFNNAANDENMIKATENGAVELYYDNVKKFETTSTGANFTVGSGEVDINSTGSGTQHSLRLLNADASAGNEIGIYFGPANNVAGAFINGYSEADFTSTANRSASLRFGVRNAGTFGECAKFTHAGFFQASNSATYDAHAFATSAHQLHSQQRYFDTVWIANTNANYERTGLRFDITRAANSSYHFITATSGGLADDEFRLRGDGEVYADGSFNSGGADYAEYFEWTDGNSSNEDRRGMTVVLDGSKVKLSTSSDSADNIIGVVSGRPTIIGDSASEKWTGKYQKDDYNEYILDSDGYRQLSPSYDDTKTYVPREERQEWDAIGMVGKLRIRKGQQTGTRWIKMRDVSDAVEEWLVR